MSEHDTGRTTIDADFAGRRRRFCLGLGEMGELERLTGQGIGGIYLRLAVHQFSVAEVWDTIRLGLEGGGTPPVEASALVMRYQGQPIADFLPLASRIVSAAVTGVPVAGKDEAGRSDGPATSPSSTQPAPSSGGAPGTSTARPSPSSARRSTGGSRRTRPASRSTSRKTSSRRCWLKRWKRGGPEPALCSARRKQSETFE